MTKSTVLCNNTAIFLSKYHDIKFTIPPIPRQS